MTGQRTSTHLPWSSEDGDAVATLRGHEIARSHDGTAITLQHSPRPHVHPIRSLDGRIVTDAAPADHVHHLGLSLAIADVDGVSYWGGATYRSDQGYAMLEDHGVQRVLGQTADADGLLQDIAWLGPDDAQQLREQRLTRIETVDVSVGAALVLTSTSILQSRAAVSLGSPATNGRAGAGYGGWFWRLAPSDVIRVFSAAGDGEAAAHGSRAPWVVFILESAGQPVSVLFRQPEAASSLSGAEAGAREATHPWFVRAEEYPGIGVALAAIDRTVITLHHPLTSVLQAVIVDAELDASAAWAIERQLGDPESAAGRGARHEH